MKHCGFVFFNHPFAETGSFKVQVYKVLKVYMMLESVEGIYLSSQTSGRRCFGALLTLLRHNQPKLCSGLLGPIQSTNSLQIDPVNVPNMPS